LRRKNGPTSPKRALTSENDPKQALTRQGKISYDAMVDHAANATFRMVRQIAQTPSPDE
jgi:hypothetical protein